jgi:hypothetical protein
VISRGIPPSLSITVLKIKNERQPINARALITSAPFESLDVINQEVTINGFAYQEIAASLVKIPTQPNMRRKIPFELHPFPVQKQLQKSEARKRQQLRVMITIFIL